MDYTISLTQTEDKALAFAALDKDAWIQNVVHARCNSAIDEIVQIAVAKCLEANMQIPSSKEQIVDLAYTQGWVKTAAELDAEVQAALAAQIAAYEAQQQGE